MFKFNCKECGAEIQIDDLVPESLKCDKCNEIIDVPHNFVKESYAAGIVAFIIGILLAIICLAAGSGEVGASPGISWFAVIAASICFFGGYISLLVAGGAAKISNTIKRLAK